RRFSGGWFAPLWRGLGRRFARRPGIIWLLAVLPMLPFAVIACFLYGHLSYSVLGGLPEGAPSVQGLRALERNFPPGIAAPITVVLRHDEIDFRQRAGANVVKQLSDGLLARKTDLRIADVRSIAEPLGTTTPARQLLNQFPKLSDLFFSELIARYIRQRAAEYYVSQAGELAGPVTRFDVILTENPYSRRALDDVDAIEAALRAHLPDGLRDSAALYTVGILPSLRDLRDVAAADQRKIEILVVAAVLLVLVVMLRRIVLSLYLIVTVVFSYLVTLGVTFVTF